MIRTKHYLLTRLANDFSQFEKRLDQLTEVQLLAPHFYGLWSVKDTLAHLTAWDRRGTRWIAEALRGEIPAVPEVGMTWADAAKLNEQTYQANQARSIQSVRTDFQDTYQALVAQVQAVTDDDLLKEHRITGSTTPVKLRNIIAWRYMHWQEHLKNLSAWKKQHHAT
jgi:hypothetical protein